MSDQPVTAEALPAAGNPADGGTAKVIYILYLIGIVVGLTAIVGVIMAYVKKNDAPAWVQNHYRFQIRTFWMAVLFSLVGAVTSVVLVGFAIMLFTVVWLIVRCIKGMSFAEKGEPVPNVTTWMFP